MKSNIEKIQDINYNLLALESCKENYLHADYEIIRTDLENKKTKLIKEESSNIMLGIGHMDK
jgi:hypothetical protein